MHCHRPHFTEVIKFILKWVFDFIFENSWSVKHIYTWKENSQLLGKLIPQLLYTTIYGPPFGFNMYTYTHILSFEVHHQLSMFMDLLIPTCFANGLGNYFSLKKKIYLQYLEFRSPSLGPSLFCHGKSKRVKEPLEDVSNKSSLVRNLLRKGYLSPCWSVADFIHSHETPWLCMHFSACSLFAFAAKLLGSVA